MTKNPIIAGTAIMTIFAVLIAWAPSQAFANGAEVILDDEDAFCLVSDGEGGSVLLEDLDRTKVIRENGAMFVCKGVIPDYEGDRFVQEGICRATVGDGVHYFEGSSRQITDKIGRTIVVCTAHGEIQSI